MDMPHKTSEKNNRIFGGGGLDFAFEYSYFEHSWLVTHLDVASFVLLPNSWWAIHGYFNLYFLFFCRMTTAIAWSLGCSHILVTLYSKLKAALMAYTSHHDSK